MSFLRRNLAVFLAALLLAVAFQWLGGARDSEFGGHADEAAHYVTGLFVRDAVATVPTVVAQRSVGPLKAFGPEARGGFYEHYPKVALGVWPPSFYLVQTMWTLPLGASRGSVLTLMAVLAAVIATMIFRVVLAGSGTGDPQARRTTATDAVPAVVAALLWLCAPLVREFYGMVMAEMLCTITMFAAAIFWGRFLDGEKARDAVWFGIFSAVAILTKGTGMALALMAGGALVAVRKWSLIKRPAFWTGGALVVVLAGPWTWAFRKKGTEVGGWADNSGGGSLAFTMEALPFYARKMIFAAGIAVAVFAVAGIVFGGSRERAGRHAAMVALVGSVFVFQCLLPVGTEERHMISATPALVVLALAGAAGLGRIRGGTLAWCGVLAALTLPLAAFQSRRKAVQGFEIPAVKVLAEAQPSARVLVCSDAHGEGMFIAELAMRDRRPNIFVERGSKALVERADGKRGTWDGKNLRSKFADETALLAWLTSGRLQYIVADRSMPPARRMAYHTQLADVVARNPGQFQLVTESYTKRDGREVESVKLYRVVRR